MEILHILQLFWIFYYLYWGWLPWGSHVVFPHSFSLHSIFQFQLSYQSWSVLPFLRQAIVQGHLHMSQCTLPVLRFRSLQTLQSVGLRPIACWNCGFESRRGHGCLSLVWVVCCQIEVSASGLIALPEESYRVWCVWMWTQILDTQEALAHWGLLRHGKRKNLEDLIWQGTFYGICINSVTESILVQLLLHFSHFLCYHQLLFITTVRG